MPERPRRTPPDWPRLLDVPSPAEYLNIGKSTVMAFHSHGALPKPVAIPHLILKKGDRSVTRPVMRRLLWDREDIDAMLQQWKGGAA